LRKKQIIYGGEGGNRGGGFRMIAMRRINRKGEKLRKRVKVHQEKEKE